MNLDIVKHLRVLWARVERGNRPIREAIADFNKEWRRATFEDRTLYLMASFADMQSGYIPDRRPRKQSFN